MKIRPGTVLKLAGAALALVLMLGIVAPYLGADQYGQRLRGSLERALGRRVEFLGPVRFSLFKGPGFSVENVVIHEDPSIGIEPMAYMDRIDVTPGFWALFGGKFVIASIRLEGASINLAKSGPASEWGRWNFSSLVNPSVLRAAPAIHIRNSSFRDSRINFKFGDMKSVFYLTQTDLDVSPPGSRGGGWRVSGDAKLARTDRPAQGLGSITVKGRWYVAPERVDLDVQLDRTGLGEITALMRGQAGSVHGTVSARLHLGGPIDNIGILGRLNIQDVHRWDLLPPQGQGWPLDIRGRLDLVAQQLELQSNSPGNAPLPLWVRFRANDYLSQPRWAVTVNWNQFPVAPLMELARHMGAQFPAKLKLSGSMDGAIGYSGEGSFQGQLAFHDTALTIPDSPPIRFDQAYMVVDHGHVRLSPAVVRTADQEQAQIEADYAMDQETLDLSISAEAMKVASLRAQVSLAAVPWLEQVRSGQWSGQLHYRLTPAKAGWTGRLELGDAQLAVPGLADPLEIAFARAQIDGARIVLDRLEAQAGKIAFTGEYRYEPGAARPHRLRLRAEEVDAADLETEVGPTLNRSTSLIARALGRTPVPAWLAGRAVEGTVQIDDLLLAGGHLENVRAHLLWDVARVEFDGIQAKLDHAAITGKLAVNLRTARPSYKLTAKVKGLDWQAGKLDADGTLETSGTGSQLLVNLTSEGNFTGTDLDFGTPDPWRSVSGSYTLAWQQNGPRLRLTGLNVRTEDETYSGRGATQDDGRLVIVLTSGSKEMRMSGTLAKLKVEEAAKQ
jgi:hypothetical protein